ncbi:MAG: thioredoxin family protein [Desulfobulbaceae bacterium]|uniref:Thioredoxin family protein n=1 Tax=Candidatus Desulfobia pelagia TaxID=2841692 RepID=A0A8J6NCA0_9BACT|nr:thioredoxin family protein [Candidatus Desulfobia pelagia]
MDELPQRKLKIDNVSVGLIGLDVALSKARNATLPDEEAVDLIYTHIKRQNYIPSTMEKQYREALGKEYRRLVDGETLQNTGLMIRILGPGCVSCNKLNTMIFDIMQRLGIAADIEQIHDLDEIWRHGVLSTPALIINGDIKCAGRMPPPAEVEQWLVAASDRNGSGA